MSKSLTITTMLNCSEVDYGKKQTQRPLTESAGSKTLASKVFGAAATAIASIVVFGAAFGIGGYVYPKVYKWVVFHKMENAFGPGDLVLELLALKKQMANPACSTQTLDTREQQWILRSEQAKIDAIVDGSNRGHYHLLIGDRGTGKLSMLLEAMRKVNGEGVSIFVAHPDLEIFRVRLGRALDFEFHEDYIGSYFSMRGPRDTTALLDIERAFNKLVMVALKRRKRVGRPLVLLITSMHLLRDDDSGRDLLELLQQRAEQWAATDLVTVIFSSDEHWIYNRLKQSATRMEVTPVGDLPRSQAIAALKSSRAKYFREPPDTKTLSRVYERIGGRLSLIDRVAKSPDMLGACESIIEDEKQRFLHHCWILGSGISEGGIEQQKYASGAMLLAQALVDAELEMDSSLDQEHRHILPEISLYKSVQVLARPDLIESYNHINLFTITPTAHIRAKSVPMQHALRKICSERGFRELHEATLKRIGDGERRKISPEFNEGDSKS